MARSTERLTFLLVVSVVAAVAAGDSFDDPYNYEYSYGDYDFHYDSASGRDSLQARNRLADPGLFSAPNDGEQEEEGARLGGVCVAMR